MAEHATKKSHEIKKNEEKKEGYNNSSHFLKKHQKK